MSRGRRDVATKILAALKARGPLTQNQLLHDVFRGNVRAAAIRSELEPFVEAGVVKSSQVHGQGRPAATIWELA